MDTHPDSVPTATIVSALRAIASSLIDEEGLSIATILMAADRLEQLEKKLAAEKAKRYCANTHIDTTCAPF
jgi:hypothetical protein